MVVCAEILVNIYIYIYIYIWVNYSIMKAVFMFLSFRANQTLYLILFPSQALGSYYTAYNSLVSAKGSFVFLFMLCRENISHKNSCS